jgi:hypothetical protein
MKTLNKDNDLRSDKINYSGNAPRLDLVDGILNEFCVYKGFACWQ